MKLAHHLLQDRMRECLVYEPIVQIKGLYNQRHRLRFICWQIAAGRARKISFIAGECVGVKEWHAKFHTDGLARYYELNSQYPDTQTAISQVPIPYPVTRRLHSDDFNANDLNSVADLKACEDIGHHFQVILILNEERRDLKTGDFAIIKNPDIYIDEETEFVVKK